jgi:Fic family protein
MANLQYNLTNALLSNITRVERLYGQIEALKVPKKLELNLERKNLIASSYASNKIEGNPLTLPEVTNLLLDDRVPTNRDEKEVVNYYGILQKLDDYKNQELSIELILKFHKKLLEGVDDTAGQIRNVQVVVGKYKEEKGNVSLKVKHNPPHHKRSDIEDALNDLFTWLMKNKDLPIIIKTGLFHHQFVYIHPFEDGNGRVCRILTALLFIQHNYQINKYFVLDDYYDIDRHEYSDKLHLADNGDTDKWLEYYSDGVRYSMTSALSKFKEAVTTMKAHERLTPQEQNVLSIIQEKHEITSQTLVSDLKVSRQQAHGLLKALLDKGLVDKKGSTKSSYYFIK